MAAHGKVIGIDLGTTNSVVSVMENGQPTVIVNQEGSRLTPSIVGFTKDGERLVGQVAKRQAVTNPENTVFSIKRFMGRTFSEVGQEASRVPYQVVAGGNNDAWIELRGKKHSAPEISAMILQKLKQAAEDYLGEKVADATRSARRPKTQARLPVSTFFASSTNRRPRLSPMASTRSRTRPLRSTTSAVARSTSPSSKSVKEWSRSRPPTVTPILAATTSIRRSSTG
jgi:hypothetical protein